MIIHLSHSDATHEKESEYQVRFMICNVINYHYISPSGVDGRILY